ncbi:hypothetical protein GXW78_09860 [Roseomonas terrae]|uniref:Tyr recombinase domain-containing protein n=1 Tax=Neoroseomonas terrae TaxID=424799 RepID=A0ABS5EG21_9PROT|nr:hypothetical protein [Neoroseomonas terrae]MBR0649968.1 hypothetical protein [Neoroseomonas terrae]
MLVVKQHAQAAGLDPAAFAGHSLRSGFPTSSAERGASLFKLMEVPPTPCAATCAAQSFSRITQAPGFFEPAPSAS